MAESVSVSPTPNKEKEDSTNMDFYSALKKIVEGKKVHKLEWENKQYYGLLILTPEGEILGLHKPDGNNYQWIVSVGDMKGSDYILV